MYESPSGVAVKPAVTGTLVNAGETPAVTGR